MQIAVIIPCLNEELTVGRVVHDFKTSLPGATVYVFDNLSKDGTAEAAKQAGATVVASLRPGKGQTVRHAFQTIVSDIYVMVDGDATYSAGDAPKLVQALKDTQADMVVGTRLNSFETRSFRLFHEFGNSLVAFMISKLFGIRVTDVLSGYRVFSRDFIKSVPLMAKGFEVETELTLQAADKGYKIVEVPTHYGERPKGSVSKLKTYSDGILILWTILTIFKNYKPLIFFTSLSALCAILSLWAGAAPTLDFIREHYVYHVPRAILSAGLGILSIQFFGIGLILDTVARHQRESFEQRRLASSKSAYANN